jgi:hypothetical protein
MGQSWFFRMSMERAILELENVNSDISDSTLISITDAEQLLQHAIAHIL